jgi:alpha-methylacyl-CoA racemase
MLARGLWRDERGANFLDGAAHFYGAYECADGKYMAVGAIEPQFYKQMLEICGVTDPAFEAQWDRRAWPALRGKLAAVFRTRTRAQWSEAFDGADACVTPILAMSEAAGHPHNVARGAFAPNQRVPQPAPPPWTGDGERRLPNPAPAIGADTHAVLRELGYPDDVVAQWLSSGSISQAD